MPTRASKILRAAGSRNHRPAAFSLVEIMIVIAIIAILMGLLFPVIGIVRKSARSAACAANLAQWGQSFQMYVNANKGKSFLVRKDLTDLTWYERLKPYNGDIHRTLLCPEATDPGNAIGSSDRGWGPTNTYEIGGPQWKIRDTYVGSYGFNGWLWRLPPAESSGPPSDVARHFISFPTPHPELIPIFADCIEEWAMPRDDDTPPYDLKNPIPRSDVVRDSSMPVGPRGMMACFCIDRHRRGINVVFLDGHAVRVPLADLWKLKWNASFTPKDVIVGQ